MAEKDLGQDKKRTYAFDSYEGADEEDLMGKRATDPLKRIQPDAEIPRFTNEELWNIYINDFFAGNWTDKLVKDLTKNWITVKTPENEGLGEEITEEQDDLDARQHFADMIRYDHVYGDGYVSIGITGNADPTEPLNMDNLVAEVNEVSYLNSFCDDQVVDQNQAEDPMQQGFGGFDSYVLRRGQNLDNGDVDPSRILHLQTVPDRDSDFGLSSYTRAYDFLRYFHSSTWSLAQALYELTFKVYKTNLAEFKKQGERSKRAKERLIEKDWTQHRLAAIDQEEDIELKAPSGQIGSIGEILELYYKIGELITGMPRSVLFGNSAGEVTGAEMDQKTYHTNCESIQDTQLRDKAERLTMYQIAARGFDPNEIPWSVEFNAIGATNEKERSEVELNLSKAAKNLIGSGAMNRGQALQYLYEMVGREVPEPPEA